MQRGNLGNVRVSQNQLAGKPTFSQHHSAAFVHVATMNTMHKPAVTVLKAQNRSRIQ